MSQSEKLVWLNGRLRPLGQTAISPLDRGFQVGYGAFETLDARDGKVFALTRHWQRLCQSCKVLGLVAPELAAFSEAIEQTLEANHLRHARVRVTVSEGSMLPGEPATMLVTAFAPTSYPREERVAIVPWPRNERSPLCAVKSLSYGENILALQHAASREAGEAVFGNLQGEVCEGATSNIFFIPSDSDELATPPLEAGCLPGVIRALILELAKKEGIPVLQRSIPLPELARVKEAFLTSSTRYVQAISHVDDHPLPQVSGPHTRRLDQLLKELMAENPDP